MRKSITLAAIAALTLAACAIFNGPAPVVTLYAQTVPATVKAQWDPNPAGDNVTSYTLTLDGGAPITVAPTVNPACSCVQTPITIPAFGSHTVAVVAVNNALSTDPASQQTSAPATLTFTLSPPPGQVKNGKITK